MDHDATFKNKWCIWLNNIQSSWLGWLTWIPQTSESKERGVHKIYVTLGSNVVSWSVFKNLKHSWSKTF